MLNERNMERGDMKVDILAAPETAGSVLYGLFDTLLLPGTAWPRIVLGEPLIDVRIVSRTTEPYTCRSGVPITPKLSLVEAQDADIVCIPNMTIPIDQCPYGWFAEEVAWLKSRFAAGAIIASVCSGSILLAEAGLLKGREATGHWSLGEMFHEYYPDIRFRPERILSFAGEGDRLIMAGGMSSWQDLVLYLITRFLGAEHAVQASKVYVISDHTEGQLPYAALSRRVRSDDPLVGQCQDWLSDHYAEARVVTRMQDLSGLPRRTFSRRFRAATGYAPSEFVQALRIEEAKQMLETTVASIDEISEAVGYRDERAFRRVFRKRTGISPSAYRKRFNHARFSSAR
jgi:transcriptional regulator GlxA family with amidase domain